LLRCQLNTRVVDINLFGFYHSNPSEKMASSSSSVPPVVAVQAEAFPDGTTDYVPLRDSNKKLDPKKPHITELPITWGNWYKHVNWLNTFFIIGVPMLGLIGAYWVPLQMKTLVFSVLYYFYTGLGITAGESNFWPKQAG
jgi:stearoyl-CoA desaturase (delta-9 desaturase)